MYETSQGVEAPKNPMCIGEQKMYLARKFGCSLQASLGIALALIGAGVTAPAALAQYSSSAQYIQQIETLVQDQQYPNRGGYSRQGYSHNESVMSHISIEAAGGFNRPLGYSRSFATWGGNVAIGGGWNFNRWFSTVAEWQYFSDKMPGAYLSNVGVPGGHIHVWGLTLEPTINYKTDGQWGGYVVGGGGFYRRVTTFTVPEQQEVCYYFCYIQNVNVPIAHYSSNQGGVNIGTGVTYKAFGAESNGKLFAEVRYVWVDTPKTNVFGTPDGTMSLLPVTLGFRW
jgi:hypothetical protein